MLEVTFKEFYEYRFPQDELHELYIMKNGSGEILYIGISSQNIWNRWLGWNGHITEVTGHLVGESLVGRKVVDHLPESWDWRIQLWTMDDCVKYCGEDLNPEGRYTIQMLEAIMIRKLHPILNISLNPSPGHDTTPTSDREKQRQKELDNAYDKIFRNKSRHK